jgi:hypothetical protein
VPWSPKQMKAIRAVKHGWKPPDGAPFHGQSAKWAEGAEREGVRSKRRKLSAREQSKALGG